MVLGGGPIGLSVIQALKAQGANKIIVSEMAQKRKEFATHFGATDIIDPGIDDVVAKCRGLTNGRGVHVVFDAAGVQVAVDSAIECLRVRGTLVNIAIWNKPTNLQATAMLLKEKRYQVPMQLASTSLSFADRHLKGIVTYARGDYQEVIDSICANEMAPAKMVSRGWMRQ